MPFHAMVQRLIRRKFPIVLTNTKSLVFHENYFSMTKLKNECSFLLFDYALKASKTQTAKIYNNHENNSIQRK